MKRVCLGKISAAHGIKGFVKIIPYGEHATLLNGPLFTGETGEDTLTVTLKNPLGKYMLAAVKDCNDRNKAEELRGTKLWIPRNALPDLEEGDFYNEDIIGLKAVDSDGNIIGEVIAVENYGAGDLLEIKQPSGKTFLLPFNDDTVVGITDTLTIQNYEAFRDLS